MSSSRSGGNPHRTGGSLYMSRCSQDLWMDYPGLYIYVYIYNELNEMISGYASCVEKNMCRYTVAYIYLICAKTQLIDCDIELLYTNSLGEVLV